MIELFFFPSPNGLKIAIMLEECGLPYRLTPIDIAKGDQFAAEFLAISPNNKIPAIIDHGADIGHVAGGSPPGEPLALFESGAILEYLAEKSGLFLPSEPRARWRVKQWLYWQVAGLGPMAGQAHHFRFIAREKVPYGIARYTGEVNRLYAVLDAQLAAMAHQGAYIAGDYSIADMAAWPWVVYHKRQGQNLDDFPQVKRWFARIGGRPAVRAAYAGHGAGKVLTPDEYKILLNQTAGTVRSESETRA